MKACTTHLGKGSVNHHHACSLGRVRDSENWKRGQSSLCTLQVLHECTVIWSPLGYGFLNYNFFLQFNRTHLSYDFSINHPSINDQSLSPIACPASCQFSNFYHVSIIYLPTVYVLFPSFFFLFPSFCLLSPPPLSSFSVPLYHPPHPQECCDIKDISKITIFQVMKFESVC